MNAFTILLGGSLIKTSRLMSQISRTKVIAADGGIRHAKHLRLNPIFWVGDFDSTNQNMILKYKNIPKIRFSQNKNMADGEIAIQKAIKMGATKIIFCGAFGGKRIDYNFFHMTATIQLLQRNIVSFLTSGGEEGWPLSFGCHTFYLPVKSIFSIVAFSRIEGLSIYGAKWTVHNVCLNVGSSWMMSNKTLNKKLFISIKKGQGILLVSNLETNNTLYVI